MPENTFYVSRKEGRAGELYVQKHLNELITSVASDITDTSTEHIEGKDFVAKIDSADIPIEVKTIRGFLFRTNDNNEENGTLGFEFWKSTKRRTPGWLVQMLFPDGKQSVQPGILMFLLLAYDRPFACVTFENVPALFERLKELAGEMGFNLDAVPPNDQEVEFSISSGLLIKNMWMVPLEKLEDLAHIAIIGEQPRLRPTIKAAKRICTRDTQRERYDYLYFLADQQRIIPYDDGFVFNGNKGTQAITIAARNLDFLESTNFDHHPELQYMNRTGTFLRLWEGLYEFMLSCEFPERKHNGDHYYPIAYEKVSRWGYQNGINSQPDAWFNVIKHLLEFELLDHYRPNKKSTNPIDIAVNKNNPYPRNVEYYSPVELTRNVLLNADYRAQSYRQKKRRTSTTSKVAMQIQSDQETADRAYDDDRTETKALKYVHNQAIELLNEELGKHNYIRVDTFYRKLWNRIRSKQKLQMIESVETPEDVKEQKRYKKFWEAYRHVEREKKEIIDDRVYKKGLVTKKDKYWLGEIPDGTYIITYAHRPECFDKTYYEALENERAKENAKRRAKRRAKKKKE